MLLGLSIHLAFGGRAIRLVLDQGIWSEPLVVAVSISTDLPGLFLSKKWRLALGYCRDSCFRCTVGVYSSRRQERPAVGHDSRPFVHAALLDGWIGLDLNGRLS